jgi:hypothetical protein
VTIHRDVELLWFADCPNHAVARQLLREIIAEQAPDTMVHDIDATDPEIAGFHRFPGSPTIRVDGVDVQPDFIDPGDYTPRCRVYWSGDRLTGVPPREWIESALRLDRHAPDRAPGRRHSQHR